VVACAGQILRSALNDNFLVPHDEKRLRLILSGDNVCNYAHIEGQPLDW
jgi:hypothetical protein